MSDLIIHNYEQGTDEWLQDRLGIATASCFGEIIAKGRGNQPSARRTTYMHKLAAERLTGELTSRFSSAATDRGHEQEPEARSAYEFISGNTVEQIGFARRGDVGCSPDGLVDDDGAIEIKSKAPHILIPVLLADEVPAEHKAQCQGVLWVMEREWIDFIAYYPTMKPMIKRMVRDEEYIKDMADKVAVFNDELNELVNKLKA